MEAGKSARRPACRHNKKSHKKYAWSDSNARPIA